jgi:hypothetical protein
MGLLPSADLLVPSAYALGSVVGVVLSYVPVSRWQYAGRLQIALAAGAAFFALGRGLVVLRPALEPVIYGQGHLVSDGLVGGLRVGLALLLLLMLALRGRQSAWIVPALVAVASFDVMVSARSIPALALGAMGCALAIGIAEPREGRRVNLGAGLILFGASTMTTVFDASDYVRIALKLAELTRANGYVPQLGFVAVASITVGVLLATLVTPARSEPSDEDEGGSDPSNPYGPVGTFLQLAGPLVAFAVLARFYFTSVDARAAMVGDRDGFWPLLLSLLAVLHLVATTLAAFGSLAGQRLGSGRILFRFAFGWALLGLSMFDEASVASGLALLFAAMAAGSFSLVVAPWARGRGLGMSVRVVDAAWLLTALAVPPTAGAAARFRVLGAASACRGPFASWFFVLLPVSSLLYAGQIVLGVRHLLGAAKTEKEADVPIDFRTVTAATTVTAGGLLAVLAPFAASRHFASLVALVQLRP